MQLKELHFLLSPAGQQQLSSLASTTIEPANHLPLVSRLREEIGAERAQAVVETVLLRQKAATKFRRAGEMYFDNEALQQASAEAISAYRADRFRRAGFRAAADLGCGIGGDSLSLSAHMEVIGVEWDPVRLAMAQENVLVYGHESRFRPLQADLVTLSPLSVEALFADPGRRDERGGRIHSVHAYRPPIDYLERWRQTVPHQAIKVSPGVRYSEVPNEAELEFISLNGDVREGLLWFGHLRTRASRRATLLPGEFSLVDEDVPDVPITRPGAFLFEPDGAVIRAHLVEQLADRLGATKIDADIAYLTTDRPEPTPFARCFAIEDVFPFQLKRLRRYLRERRVGQVIIKKRGSPLDPETLRHRLRLRGDQQRIVFLTQVMGEPTVLVGQAHEA